MPNKLYLNSNLQIYLKFKNISNLTCTNRDLCSAAENLLCIFCPSQFIATLYLWVFHPNIEDVLPLFSISSPTSNHSVNSNVLRMCQEFNFSFSLPSSKFHPTSQLISCDSFQTTCPAFSHVPLKSVLNPLKQSDHILLSLKHFCSILSHSEHN